MLISKQLENDNNKNNHNNDDDDDEDDDQSCIIVGSAPARTFTTPLATPPAPSSCNLPPPPARRPIPAVESLHDTRLEQDGQKLGTELSQKQQRADALAEEQLRLIAEMGDMAPAIDRELQGLDEDLELERKGSFADHSRYHEDLDREVPDVTFMRDVTVVRAWWESLVVGWVVTVVMIMVFRVFSP